MKSYEFKFIVFYIWVSILNICLLSYVNNHRSIDRHNEIKLQINANHAELLTLISERNKNEAEFLRGLVEARGNRE